MMLSNIDLKFLKRLALLAFLAFVLLFSFSVKVHAQESGNVAGIDAAPDSLDCEGMDPEECLLQSKPPTLKLVEIWAVKGIYLIWAFGGFIFVLGLFAIGFAWLTSGGDPQKLEELKKKATYWAISIPVFFGGYPAINFLLQIFPLNVQDECYKNLNQPAFQIIFPDSCGLNVSVDEFNTMTCDPSSGGRTVIVVGTSGQKSCKQCDGKAWSDMSTADCNKLTGQGGESREESEEGEEAGNDGIQSATDDTGGCCTRGAAEGSVNGCFPNESCSVGNGACASGNSCERQSVSDFDLLNDPRYTCNNSRDGQTFRVNTTGGNTVCWQCDTNYQNNNGYKTVSCN